MYTLLPEKYVAKLKREYRVRFATMFFFFITIALAIGAVSLFPSYILSRGQERQATQDLSSLKKIAATSGADQVEKDALNTKTLVRAITGHQDAVLLSDIVESIVAHRKSSVTISSLEVGRPSPTAVTARISGVALTRDALVAFKKELEGDARFIKVELPVSDLAKSKNIRFSMNLSIKI